MNQLTKPREKEIDFSNKFASELFRFWKEIYHGALINLEIIFSPEKILFISSLNSKAKSLSLKDRETDRRTYRQTHKR